jgi:hypothetical protein
MMISTSGLARRVASIGGVRGMSHLKEGAIVPNVVFKVRVRDASIQGPNPFAWKDVSTKDLFANKRVVLFALPGGELND